MMRRLPLVIGIAIVIAVGLIVSLVPLGLPRIWTHRIGAVLWGAMVMLIVAALQKRADMALRAIAAAMALTAAVEIFKLLHTPDLDAFRLTLAGGLLLARVYNPWNIALYWLGIGLAVLFFAPIQTRSAGD